jgi:DNA-binding transcriptional ArsR family regulator
MSYKRQLAMKVLRNFLAGRPVERSHARVALAELEGRDEPTKLPPTLLGLQIIAMIKSHRGKHGVPPTYDQMAAVLEKAKSTIHAHVLVLEERGFVRLNGPRRKQNVSLTRKAAMALKPTTMEPNHADPD